MSLSAPSQDWMVLQCTTCSARMKVRREVAMASRLLCPHCRTPVPVAGETNPDPVPPVASPAAASGSPTLKNNPAREFRPSGLPERPAGAPDGPEAFPHRAGPSIQGRDFSNAPRETPPGPAEDSGILPAPRTHHPEFSGGLPDETDDGEEDDGENSQHVPPGEKRRVRIKKRKARRPSALRYLELTDWDQKDLTEIPEAEISADIWADRKPLPEDVLRPDEEHEYVVESTDDEDGQTRTTKKKVRPRRLMLGARLFFQRFTWISRNFTTGLALLLAGAAAYGFYVFQQEYTAPPLPPVVAAPIDRSVLTSYDVQGAEKAVRDFLAADGIEAKLAFVRHPQRVRPLMQRWYRGERSAGPLEAGEVTLKEKYGGDFGTKAYYVLLAMPVFVEDPLNPGSTYEEQTFFSIEEIREGPSSTYLVDWETSVGYQEIPLETFKATMPSEPYPFRIFMKADDYYNHGFEEREWQCVSLYYPGRSFRLYGYINRNTVEGRSLLNLIGEERSAGIIAELAYPSPPGSRDQVIVQRMLHNSWYYDKPEDAAQLGDPILPDPETE